MKKSTERLIFICHAAAIAALYTVLTTVIPGISSGVIQFRFSEALCILAVFTPAAIPGMTVGCVFANLLNGCAPWDVVFGSLATLIGVIGVRLLRKIPYIAALPYALSNIIIIPFVLKLVYGAEETVAFLFMSIGISEFIAAYVLGTALYFALRPVAGKVFRKKDGQ